VKNKFSAHSIFFAALFAVSLAAVTATPLSAQLSPSSPAVAPPMWQSDPLIQNTGDWAQWKMNCHDMATDFGKDTFIACATSTFRSRPFHFVAQSVVPGSGVGGAVTRQTRQVIARIASNSPAL
jgi:hypothetical protein